MESPLSPLLTITLCLIMAVPLAVMAYSDLCAPAPSACKLAVVQP